MPKDSIIDKMIENQRHETVEQIQEAIVQAGGRFFKRSEILSMRIHEFIELFTTNGITMNVVYNKESHDAIDPIVQGYRHIGHTSRIVKIDETPKSL